MGDRNYTSVSLLLGGESLSDTSSFARTLTASGSAAVDSSVFKYGTASLKVPGSSDFYAAAGAEMSLTGDFCVEGWVRVLGFGAAYGAVIASDAATYASGADLIFVGGDTAAVADRNRLCAGGFGLNNAGVPMRSAVISLNTWYHFAFTRSGTTVRLFLDGVLQASGVFTPAFNLSANGGFRVGRNRWDGANGYLNANIDDLRVTKSAARYTANFTPPPAAFSAWLPYVSGTVLNESGAPAARQINAHRFPSGALVGTGTSDSVTGAYQFNVDEEAEVYLAFLDDAAGATYNHKIVRTVPI